MSQTGLEAQPSCECMEPTSWMLFSALDTLSIFMLLHSAPLPPDPSAFGAEASCAAAACCAVGVAAPGSFVVHVGGFPDNRLGLCATLCVHKCQAGQVPLKGSISTSESH